MTNKLKTPHTETQPLPTTQPLTSTQPFNSLNFRSAYSPRVRVAITFTGPGRTRQSFKDECDINVIMARYMRTGTLDFLNQREAQYADVTGRDYQQAMLLVAGARSMFQELPSELRSRFDNEPQKLLEFMENEQNLDEAIKLGLVRPKPKVDTPTAPPPAPSQPTPALARPSGVSVTGEPVPAVKP